MSSVRDGQRGRNRRGLKDGKVRWRTKNKSTSISPGVIKSLMKEVDLGSDFLLSCCCLLLPMMSANGIQLMTGEEKCVQGREGWDCNGALCACLC